MRRALITLAFASGCSLPAGNWFLELHPTARAAYVEAPERAVEPGWQKLASEYQVHLTAGTLQASSIELFPATEAATAFDPAEPPPGYGPCHNGHCHTADGRLLSYAEVAAAISGEAAPSAAVTLAGGAWDLLAPAALPLACTPDCRLGNVSLGRLRVNLARVHLEGVVRDGPGVLQPIGSLPFSFDLDAATAPLPALDAALDVPADNQHPPRATLAITLAPGAVLFDQVAWTDSAAAPSKIRAALAEIPIVIDLQRSNP
jgi:hypothetical protein